MAPTAFQQRQGPVVGRSELRLPEIWTLHTHSLNDGESVIEAVRNNRTVLVNLGGLSQCVGQRLIDYVCGGVVAMDGQVHRLGEGVVLFAPALARVELA